MYVDMKSTDVSEDCASSIFRVDDGATCSSLTSVNLYQTTRRHTPEGNYLYFHSHRRRMWLT
jgi:hypothetical protein